MGLRGRTIRLFELLRTLFSAPWFWRIDPGNVGTTKGFDGAKAIGSYTSHVDESRPKGCFVHDHACTQPSPLFSSSPPATSVITNGVAPYSSPRIRTLTLTSITEEERDTDAEDDMKEDKEDKEQIPNGQTKEGYTATDEPRVTISPIKRVFSDLSRIMADEPSPIPEDEDAAELDRYTANSVWPGQSRGQPKVRPIVPYDLRRYDRNIVIAENNEKWSIEPLLPESAFKRKPREGWSLFVHPEGSLYHSATIGQLRFTTDIDIFEDANYNQLMAFTRHIHHKLTILRQEEKFEENELRSMHDTEIVFELDSDDGSWEYYIADHNSRHLFWLDDYPIPSLIAGGDESLAHIKIRISYEYYTHLSFFPFNNSLPDTLLDELQGMITWSLGDTLTSLDSLSPYADATLERFLSIVDRLRMIQDKAPTYVVATAARLWSLFEFERYFNFSGVPGARISREQSVRGAKGRTLSSLTRFLSLLLFQVPVKRLTLLDGVYVDHQVKQVAFKTLTSKMVESWQAEVINSAVLLNANVAYLAIPGILDSSEPNTLGVVASLISIVMSLASVILGLLLTKRLRGYDEKGINDAARFLGRWWHAKQGLIKLALMFSLPYAMLMWGAISFVVAVVFMAIKVFEINIPFLILIGVFAVALLICGWTILQIDSWATFIHGLQFWKHMEYHAVPENERHIVAQRITRARRKATARTVQLVRSASILAAAVVPGRSNTFIARPGIQRAGSSPA